MSEKCSETEIHRFIKAFVESKNGEITKQSDGIFTVKYEDQTSPIEYTYDPAVSREKKALLMAPGSSAFQQILNECLENGALCQVSLDPKEKVETLLKKPFKDSLFSCEDCEKIAVEKGVISACVKPQPCYHSINNAKIVSVEVTKKDPMRYFLFYFSVSFQNKLRAKNDEIITILVDEMANAVVADGFSIDNILRNETIEIQDFKGKFTAPVFDGLKTAAREKLDSILREKLVLFDLPLAKDKKSKLRSFEKRLRRERHEQIISKKIDFDQQKWQTNYEALLKREEESFITNIAVKFVNLLVINTTKVKFELGLDNNSTIHSSFILGINYVPEVTCPICRRTFSEGYATQDALYVCGSCIKQSIDTAKIYSAKAALRLDETLNEYIEQNAGFVCSVCGKKHSRLLEFKCNHDNSSICIYHYELCDMCGNIFSRLNLSHTDEFKRQLCPKHAVKDKSKER